MKILLVGEYSGLHNTLKQGLLQLGHEVQLVGTGDGFKKYPVDLDHKAQVFSRPLLRPFVKLVEKLTSFNLIQFENGYRFKKLLPGLKGYDIVQLINEHSIRARPKQEIRLLKKLFKQNGEVFLLSCGTDHLSVKFALEKKYRYSILTPYLEDPDLKPRYRFILKYLKAPFKKLHNFVFSEIQGVIASDLDYHLPLLGLPKYLGLAPNPIKIESLKYHKLNFNDKIIIFHGVNTSNYIKKGSGFFDDALDIIKKRYPTDVLIIHSENLPYKEYINAYNKAHIVMDQVYAYDQGFNALEAMTKGKVVFTGAEKEWLDYYGLTEDSVAINALPDVDYLVSKLEWLLLNREKIKEISENARVFIKKEHDHITAAERYLNYWGNHLTKSKTEKNV